MKEGWIRRALRWLDAGRPESNFPAARSSPGDQDDPYTDAPKLTSAQLCRAWRVSFLAVVRAGTPAELEALAAKRRAYLDELEKRNPRGFQAWLDTAPGASSDPEPYLLDEYDSDRRGSGA